jgi:Zn ribbon nucleic-acid-binding protein
MAKREHFITHVTCPECALNGSATLEDDEKGNLETTVKILSPGFTVGPDSEIHCVECGVKAQIGQTLSPSEKRPATSNLDTTVKT